MLLGKYRSEFYYEIAPTRARTQRVQV